MPNVRDPRTPGEEQRVANLLSLAEDEFGEGLSKADRDVVQAAALGEIAEFGDAEYYRDLTKAIAAEQAAVKRNDPELPPATDRPKPSTIVMPSVIRWLLTSEAALEHVHAKGVWIAGVRLESTLDLHACVCERPLTADAAWLKGVDLLYAQCKTVAVQRSFVEAGAMGSAVFADGVRVTGGVFFRNGFRSKGEVRLLGAEIGSVLDCTQGVFLNAGGYALNADGVRVTGGVFFRNGFRSEGEVRLLGAEIGSDLECVQGVFLNEGKDALSASRVRVTGGVFLSKGFRADGEVRFSGAAIGRNFSCDNGRFRNKGGATLEANGARVTGGVFLRHGFRAEGEVGLTRAEIGGHLDCSKGLFRNKGQIALNANTTRAKGGMFLVDARVRGLVNVTGAEFDSGLDARGGKIRNPPAVALEADSLRTNGSVHLSSGFHATGQVRLLGAEIKGDLGFERGIVENPGRVAITLNRANIKGIINFIRGFRAEGRVKLVGAKAGELQDDLPEGASDWPAKFDVTGFRYERIRPSSPLDATRRLRWLKAHDEVVESKQSHDSPPDPQPYRQLAEVLRKQGHGGDADIVMRACARRRIWPRVNTFLTKGGSAWAFPFALGGLLVLLAVLSIEGVAPLPVWSFVVIGLGVVSLGVLAWQAERPTNAAKYKSVRRVAGYLLGVRTFISEWIYLLLVGHGYARWRVLVWAIGFTLLGVWVFGHQEHRRIQPAQPLALRSWQEARDAGWTAAPSEPLSLLTFDNPINKQGDDLSWVASYPQFNAVVYSLDTFLPLVSFGQESAWTLRNGERWSGRWWAKQVYLPFHIGSGWVIATLFVASFTRLMRPE
ncbi:MAG: hypothetical protein AAGI53_00785 [Planctomycetota bacterium]